MLLLHQKRKRTSSLIKAVNQTRQREIRTRPAREMRRVTSRATLRWTRLLEMTRRCVSYPLDNWLLIVAIAVQLSITSVSLLCRNGRHYSRAFSAVKRHYWRPSLSLHILSTACTSLRRSRSGGGSTSRIGRNRHWCLCPTTCAHSETQRRWGDNHMFVLKLCCSMVWTFIFYKIPGPGSVL